VKSLARCLADRLSGVSEAGQVRRKGECTPDRSVLVCISTSGRHVRALGLLPGHVPVPARVLPSLLRLDSVLHRGTRPDEFPSGKTFPLALELVSAALDKVREAALASTADQLRTEAEKGPDQSYRSGPVNCDDASRGGGIRTHDLFVPNEARYQAAPHPA
jgi:hypothetical protein